MKNTINNECQGPGYNWREQFFQGYIHIKSKYIAINWIPVCPELSKGRSSKRLFEHIN